MSIPGSGIPQWFIHQSIGAELNIKEPSSHMCDDWMGIAFCFVSSPLLHFRLSYRLIANGKVISSVIGASYEIVDLPDQIFLSYVLPQYHGEKEIKLLNECEANELSQIGIKITTSLHSGMEVKKCGFRMVYKKDIEDLNRTMAQSSNININIISYKDLDVKKAKQICDDYDEAGPSGEGSSNDVPHGNSNSEEYFEWGEEISD